MARWTAVDRETGEIIEYPSRSAMRAVVRENPSLRARERPVQYIETPSIGGRKPPWDVSYWGVDPVTDKRAVAYGRAGPLVYSSYIKAIRLRDAPSANRIREGWVVNIKGYAEGRLDAQGYTDQMKDFLGWLYTTPYAPPVKIWYHEAQDDYTPEEMPEYEDDDNDYDGEE